MCVRVIVCELGGKSKWNTSATLMNCITIKFLFSYHLPMKSPSTEQGT